MDPFTILPYQDQHREQILTVWERSVVATHDFLTPEDFTEIKKLVQTIDFNAFPVFCLLQDNQVIGFLGVAEQNIEMLFLDPDYIGKGLGKKLIIFAMDELKAVSVDVNEQNRDAVKFYQKFGFQTYDRTEKDDQGMDYPILKMRLE